MDKKYLWVLGAVVVIGLAVGAAVYYKGVNNFSSLLGNNDAPEPGPVTYLPAPEEIVTTPEYKTPESTPVANVTAITATSVTVEVSGTTKSFAISSQTPVYSTVLVAQVGRGLQDISVGSRIVVYWREENPTAATALSFPRDEALSLTAEDNNRILSGKVGTFDGSSVVVTPFDANLQPVVITVDSATKIATTVVAGQMGQRLKEGDIVVARGVSTSDGKTTAKAIVVAPPLP